ncbi:ROK family protein [Gracilibacillus massiliensis]|uniref:ROK family protein n=1 Tax=Gracilibacillus massiliensis TaxID=1564956 RepID=UPI00071C6BB9|nr:ROK family protein [Gracilibacillus massiliensis]
MYYGAIEAGGTKFVCAVSDSNLNIVEKINIPTTEPKDTMKEVFRFFNNYSLQSIGIGSFGPIDVNKESKKYGYITTTPKKGWSDFDFVGFVQNQFDIPIAWTTDVNASAYGEYKLGGAHRANSCLYLTVGTGIGGGAIINDGILEGFGHPEMGHILIRKHPEDNFDGNCPFHSNCLEGLASGPAIEKRIQNKANSLKEDDPYWNIESYYLAQALVNYTFILRPEVIILGGGVMDQKHLFPKIRKEYKNLMKDYVNTLDLDEFIIEPGLNGDQGLMGCLLLAKDEINK